MSHRLNSRQLVLRRDTATGLTLVGWDAELPLGRFEHLELICESKENRPPERSSESYKTWQTALHHARQLNQLMLEQQAERNQSQGWIRVPFKLAYQEEDMVADQVGNYADAAMQLLHQLTQNQKQVWAVIQEKVIAHVRARYPRKELDEFTYQVWLHKQLHELNKIAGTLQQGQLIVCESGLWFEVE